MSINIQKLSLEEFLELTSDKVVRNVAGKYDWNKVWEYLEQNKQPVTVTEIHIRVMSEVPHRRQIRAWMERQVKNDRLVKKKHPITRRVFYLPSSIYEEYLKKQEKTRTDT